MGALESLPSGLGRVGISSEGFREVLGVWVADSESEASWGEVFSDLSRRAARRPLCGYLTITPACTERLTPFPRCAVARLSGALPAQYPESHGSTRESDGAWVATHDNGGPNPGYREKGAGEAVEALGRRVPELAELLDSGGEEILSLYQLPNGIANGCAR